MNLDDIFGVLLLFLSVLFALVFMILLIRKEAMASKVKSNAANKKIKD